MKHSDVRNHAVRKHVMHTHEQPVTTVLKLGAPVGAAVGAELVGLDVPP